MSANELLEDVRLGTETSFRRLFLVQSPTDADGNAVDPRFDSDLPGFGTSVVELPFAISGMPEKVETRTLTISVISVPYETPTALDPGLGGEWHMRFSGSLQSRRVNVERRTDEEIADKVIPRIVGAYRYRLASTLVNPMGLTPTEFTAGKGGKLLAMLGPRDTWQRDPVGMEQFDPVGSVILTKMFGDTSEARLSELAFRLTKINSDEMSLPGFRVGAFGVNEVMLSDYDTDTIRGPDPSNPIVDVMTVVFAIQPGGWQEQVTHEWTDPDVANDGSHIVLGKGTAQDDPFPLGEPVVDTFRRQLEIPFNGWVESL